MNKNIWNNFIESENNFWKNWIKCEGSKNKNSNKKKEFIFRMDPNSSLQEYINNILLDYFKLNTTINILDVGAGPCTMLGKKSKNFELKITATDALANLYYKDDNFNPPIKTLQLETEKLSTKFNKETFDFIYCRNALDHHYDPILSIEQMIMVLKKKGIMLIEHRTNEAVVEKYQGLHQFNLCIKNNNFYIWNKEIDVNMSQYLKEKFNINIKILDLDNGIPDYHFILIEKI
jgi:SAM-dependent methyltransferase